MLLSSAKFETEPDGPRALDINVKQRVGLDLILPVASILPLERRVQWNEKFDIPLKVLDTLADGAEFLAAALAKGKFVPVEKLLARWPNGGKVAAKALPILTEAVKLAGPKLQAMNVQARAQHDYLRATLTQFKLDLERGVVDKVIRNPK